MAQEETLDGTRVVERRGQLYTCEDDGSPEGCKDEAVRQASAEGDGGTCLIASAT